ncbi:hypothetical protein EH243_14615 [Amphritea opalescens]|uniref:Adhesin n=1 Tax=Amphritea opalescens TaxID=2490544 RepID=A0A430KN55_9GAMM|nr:hypothetical protein [Amphritea opalescens]RTE64910.1 hypothetical protein EH243_14615 [Amphritea opalescens]
MKHTRCIHTTSYLFMLLMATNVSAEISLSDEQYGSSHRSVITDSALEGSVGIIGVNIAAGDSNTQLNARALAVSFGQGVDVNASVKASQYVGFPDSDSRASSAVSLIEGNAFANASGLISVNHASGSGNAQLNDVSIGFALGGTAVTESELNLTVTGQPAIQSDNDLTGHREVSIGEGAFDGSSGLVQVNQLAGSGNTTHNSFGLSVSLQTKE